MQATITNTQNQLLDEIRILVNDVVPSATAQAGMMPCSFLTGDVVLSPRIDTETFRSALLVEDNGIFEVHLKDRSSKIRTAITDLFGKIPPTVPEVKELQERLASLLASEKAHLVELQRITAERDQFSERLENASLRYLIAEKKLDRAKSKAVQELEQQAIMRTNTDSANASSKQESNIKTEGSTEVNGQVDAAASAAAESARREAVATAEKRKVQVEQLEEENKRLTEQLTSAKIKSVSASDEDYAKSDLFKLLKSQHEDVIKRVNDLEATNVQLREEAQKMHAERTAFRNKLDDESRAAMNENESQMARTETDLARIRNLRDELTADMAIRKAAQEQQQLASESAKELAKSRESRITALESEIERYKLQIGETSAPTSDALDQLDADSLKTKLRTIQNQYDLLSNELPSMEAAWKKTQALAAKKVADITAWEEQLSRLSQEKVRADQKYFAAMKAKESRENELRAVKMQSGKTSEIVAQLKDAESSTRSLAINLEKQLAEAKESLTSLTQQHRALQQKLSEGSIVSEGLKTEIAELKKLIVSKDTAASSANSARRQAEVELEELKSRLEETKKSLDILKKKGVVKDAAESDDWRVSRIPQTKDNKCMNADKCEQKIAICPVCNSNLRNTVLKLCSHVFCSDCVQNLISHRSRKCPACARAFGTNDHMPIILT